MRQTIISSLFLILFNTNIYAQSKKEIIKKMKAEVSYLASDDLKGRETGTDSEKLAADYIASKFKEYNLIEKGKNIIMMISLGGVATQC